MVLHTAQAMEGRVYRLYQLAPALSGQLEGVK